MYEPLYKASAEDITAAWMRARNALNYILNILRGDARIDSSTSTEIAALVELSFTDIGDKTVAVIRADSFFKPVFVEDNDHAEFYVRSGNTTQQLDVKQTTEHVNHRFPAIA